MERHDRGRYEGGDLNLECHMRNFRAVLLLAAAFSGPAFASGGVPLITMHPAHYNGWAVLAWEAPHDGVADVSAYVTFPSFCPSWDGVDVQLRDDAGGTFVSSRAYATAPFTYDGTRTLSAGERVYLAIDPGTTVNNGCDHARVRFRTTVNGVVYDAETDFSNGVQGVGGWYYLYDSGYGSYGEMRYGSNWWGFPSWRDPGTSIAIWRDADDDGIADGSDTCPGFPDSISGDADRDGTCDPLDVCPTVYDDQKDTDGDGIGNACERDTDADGKDDDDDNCVHVANPDQADNDFDGMGDVCDADDDDDGYADTADNCPILFNEQADYDRDGQGDACDGDDDADGIDDDTDLCPGTALDLAFDADGCSGVQGVALACPTDGDWDNHGDYVSCVSHAVSVAVDAGLLTRNEGASLTRTAARSAVGK